MGHTHPPRSKRARLFAASAVFIAALAGLAVANRVSADMENRPLFEYRVTQEGGVLPVWAPEAVVRQRNYEDEKDMRDVTIKVPNEFASAIEETPQEVDIILVIKNNNSVAYCYHWHGSIRHCHSN